MPHCCIPIDKYFVADTVDHAIQQVMTEEKKYAIATVCDWIQDNLCECCNPLEWIMENYKAEKCQCAACCMEVFVDSPLFKGEE